MYELIKSIFEADLKTDVTICHQYIQTAFIEIAIGIADPKNTTYNKICKEDALNTLKKIKALLRASVSPGEETKAHRGNLRFLIANALIGEKVFP